MSSKMSDSLHHERRDVPERRQVHRYVFKDRRSGFDRRRRYAVLDLVRDDRQLIAALAIVNLLSLGDGLLTWMGLQANIITEGNPILASLINASPSAAVVFKVGVVVLVSVGIWHGRKYRAILGVTIFALVVYAGVIAYHAATVAMVAALT